MSRFLNTETKVVVSVDDDKDDRFSSPLWEKQAERKSSAKSSGKTEK